jgi:hypothetical protein
MDSEPEYPETLTGLDELYDEGEAVLEADWNEEDEDLSDTK